jgi:hypothetical protein
MKRFLGACVLLSRVKKHKQLIYNIQKNKMMRTSLKIMFAIIPVCMILSNTNVAKATEIHNAYTTFSPVREIRKLVVTGNVKVTLIQAGKERVEVYGNDFQNDGAVQQEGTTLKINSFRKTPLAVVVFVNNLNEISASDKVSVKTRGTFKLLNLRVKLQGQATADINAGVWNLYTKVTERADLTLYGAAESHTIVMNSLGHLNMDLFLAKETAISPAGSDEYVTL